MQNNKLARLPYVVVFLVFILHLSLFQIYDKENYFKAPLNLKLNIDTPGYGACAGDFPNKFIQQTRCGYYNLMRPLYPFLLFVLSKPVVWTSDYLLPDSFFAKLQIPKEQVPFAAASFIGIPLNLFFVFLTLMGLKKLFNHPKHSWMAQMLYATSYGLAAYIAHPILEIPQQTLTIWMIIFFQDKFNYFKLLGLALGLTAKEIVSVYASGFYFLFKNKKLNRYHFLIPLPLLLWLLWLHFGHSVVIRSHGVNDFGFGLWFLNIFSQPALFMIKLKEVITDLVSSLLICSLLTFTVGLVGSIQFFKKIPEIIKINFILALLQLVAMGYITPRITFNFLWLPLLFGSVFWIDHYFKKKQTQVTLALSTLGFILGCFNIYNLVSWR